LGSGATPPTEVCITVDTEFSIGGAFADPERYRPLSRELVDCAVDGRAEGLGFLLSALREHRIRATFFVEVLQCFYFGERPMGRIAERIAEEGHDLQLHLHPCWLGFRHENWRYAAVESDDCAARSLGQLRRMIEFGLAQFTRWQLAPPTALRTGSFSFAPAVHQAMAECGIKLGSNIALALYRPAEPEFHLASGSRMFDGVLEIPALTYAAVHVPLGSPLRTLAITSTSWRELEALLWLAREAAISPVVVLTHPFEFVKHRDFRFRELRRDHVNQQRLERLLEFLARHNDEFSATTFGRSGGAWFAAGGKPGRLLQAPWRLSLPRLAENAANTLLWRY
jgi:peptidoglycan/xylan/chitin deacetylase (PgdA/CDA1 family)